MEPRSPAAAPRDTRRVLVEAALDLFAEHGFAGTSMRTLARQAGVRESAIYHHFPSKDALFAGVVKHVLEARAGDITAALERLDLTGTLAEVLTAMSHFAVTRMQIPMERKFWRILILEAPRLAQLRPTVLVETFQRPLMLLLQMLMAQRAAGRIREDLRPEVFLLHFAAPLIVATQIAGSAHGGLLPIALPEFVQAHVEFLVRAVAP